MVTPTSVLSMVALSDYKSHRKKGQVKHLLSIHCVWLAPHVLTRGWADVISLSPPIAP